MGTDKSSQIPKECLRYLCIGFVLVNCWASFTFEQYEHVFVFLDCIYSKVLWRILWNDERRSKLVAGQVSSDNEQRQMMLANSKVVHSRRPLLLPPIAKACSSISEAIFQTRITLAVQCPKKGKHFCDFLSLFRVEFKIWKQIFG